MPRPWPLPNRLWLAMLMLLSSTPTPAWAHPESVSSIEVLVRGSGVRVSLTLQTRDLDQWFPPANHADYKGYVLEGLKKQAGQLFDFQADGQAVTPATVRVAADKPGCVRLELELNIPAGTQSLVVHTRSLERLPPGHKQLLCAEDVREASKPGDSPPVLAEQTLTADEDSVEISLTNPSTMPATRPSH